MSNLIKICSLSVLPFVSFSAISEKPPKYDAEKRQTLERFIADAAYKSESNNVNTGGEGGAEFVEPKGATASQRLAGPDYCHIRKSEGMKRGTAPVQAAIDCEPDFPPPPPPPAVCTGTYLWSSHSWKWKSYYVYGYNKASAVSENRCSNIAGRVIPVNSISITGATYTGTSGWSEIGIWDIILDKQGYNTGRLEVSDTLNWVGSADHPCGAEVVHSFVVNGMSYQHVTRSGCRE